MAPRTLIVVHGMGSHTKASVKKTVTESFRKSLKLYPSHKTDTLGSLFDIEIFNYNKIFEKYRKVVVNESGALSEILSSIDQDSTVFGKSVQQVNELGLRFASDEDFFNSHILDVILYRYTFLGELVRLELAASIMPVIAKKNAANVEILGHSLGTSVVHDTLVRMYGSAKFEDKGVDRTLDSTENRLAGVHMVANVSRALWSIERIGSSIVKPGVGGCVASYREYRHELDPIPMVRAFNPTSNGEWISPKDYRLNYHLERFNTVTRANVHSLDHYLDYPGVHIPIFASLFDFFPSDEELEAALGAYTETTVSAHVHKLQDAFADPVGSPEQSVTAILDAAFALKQRLISFGENF